MLKSYLTIAWRSLRQQKGYALINVGGLAVGMACCLLILLFVRDKLSYDRFHANAERIYRVNLEAVPELGVEKGIAVTPPIVAPLLARELPVVEKAVRLYAGDGVVRHDDRAFQEEKFYFADSTFFGIFDFAFVAGSPATALARPNAVVLTAPTAERYFGDEDPLGQTLLLNNAAAYEVTGVIKEVPHNAHFRFDFVASYASLKGWAQRETWGSANFYTYLLLREGADAETLEGQIDQLLAERRAEGDEPRPLSLMPLTRIHLHADLAYALDPTGDIRYVWIFSAMAVLVLLLACINYMNLATARAGERGQEIGMRKALGATRVQLMGQVYGESVVLVLIALILAVGLVQVGLPLLNALGGTEYAFADLPPSFLLAALGGIGLLVGVVAGSYPALVLSASRPARALKGVARTSRGAARFRQGLVVFQFAISVFFIVGALAVYGQLDYLQTKNLGFDKEQIVVLPLDDAALRQRYPALVEAFAQHPGIQSASAVNQYPSALGATFQARAEGLSDDAQVLMKGFITDEHVVETLGLKLLAGRGFPETLPHPDSVEAGYRYLLNATAARTLGWAPEEALGKRFNMLGGRAGEVVGVVQDFHFASLHDAIEPMAIWYHPDQVRHFLVRLAPGDVTGALAFMERRWQGVAPHRPFDYRFLDDAFDALYRSEQQVGRVFGVFALLAVFVACLGLFGLAAFAAAQRTKEIGVRKVLGASVASIVALLSKDFLKLVAVAFVLAAPVAYYAVARWLEGFAYHANLGAGVFLGAGGAALVVALLTVSVQAFRAATADPVQSLRHE